MRFVKMKFTRIIPLMKRIPGTVKKEYNTFSIQGVTAKTEIV